MKANLTVLLIFVHLNTNQGISKTILHAS